MMMSSVGDAMSADAAPATAAQPKRLTELSGSPPERASSCFSMKRLVPNWLAVMGAMLQQLICRRGAMHAACVACRGGVARGEHAQARPRPPLP
jgi:hypothetical protein